MKRRSRLTSLFVIIAVGYLVSWGPLSMGLFVDIVYPAAISTKVLQVLVSFTLLNSCINVIVYAIKDKEFRKDVIMRIPCKRRQYQNTAQNSATDTNLSHISRRR